MTLEKLLGKTADELDAFSDEQLIDWFKPMFIITRPELQPPRAEKTISKNPSGKVRENLKNQALEILKQHGITNIKRW